MLLKNIYEIESKNALYGYHGRLWHTEIDGEITDYKSIEDLVEKNPEFKSLERIQATLERRGYKDAKPDKKRPTPEKVEETLEEEIKRKPKKEILKKEVTCYYCSGSGEAGYLKCPNCNGAGTIIVDNKGLYT